MALDAYFDDARRRVQARPSDLGARSALWQIFAARGEFARARTQLEAMVAIDSSWAMEASACGLLLQAEEQRQQVFGGATQAVCLGDPPAWFAELVSAMALLSCADPGARPAAARLLRQAQQASPACAGTVNGQPVAWLCDGDARLGPCLELMVRGQYFWVPWERVRSLTTRPPTELRDRLWLHALVGLGDEATVEGFLPARYPQPRNDEEHLGQRTEWLALDDAGEVFQGHGQKTLIADSGEWGLLEVRELRLQTVADAPKPI